MMVTMGMEMAMASGRFLQVTQANNRGRSGELSCGGGGGDCPRGQGQADLAGEVRMILDGVWHLICLGTCVGGL